MTTTGIQMRFSLVWWRKAATWVSLSTQLSHIDLLNESSLTLRTPVFHLLYPIIGTSSPVNKPQAEILISTAGYFVLEEVP
ncbi:hypothetical protein N7462_001427 [Penicillium macrosclerotiorum]|uniref:uncharacterized protein n=1 Tax=Penicillium macrosclerotiorum TaxID=303699 RepID=UPI00254928D9|nr:uncharacterized protein N7462_001427 [Penicillium macrosclerotiorum]KAJ5692004.1 hypothetical protein N7462_001427 [Penicillium macrosclerotiorum]